MGRGRIDPGWGFVAPALLAIGAFFFVPVVASLLLSFTDFDVYAVARPDRLRLVRQDISEQRPDSAWAEPLALLYDDPHRPLPGEETDPVDAPS